MLAELIYLGSVQDKVNFAVAGRGHGQEVIEWHLVSLLGTRDRDSAPDTQGSGRPLVLSLTGVFCFLCEEFLLLYFL